MDALTIALGIVLALAMLFGAALVIGFVGAIVACVCGLVSALIDWAMGGR